ncbi:metallophosphoesterase family protein [Thermodesulfobacteriota bacterium]
MRIAHLSDLHFGKEASRVKEQSLREDLHCLQPDLLVISGDVTDRGSVSQFRRARRFFDSLGIPFLSVPGNREISFGAVWEWMLPRFAMTRYRSYFGQDDKILYVSEEHKVVLFGLNSVHPLPSWPGRLERETRYWLKEKAAGFHGYFKGLFLHHPVVPVIRSSSFWAHSLSDAGEVLNICTQSGISLILQGHKHRSAVVELYYPDRDAKVVVSSGGAPLMPHWDSIYHIVDIFGPSLAVQPREFLDGNFVGRTRHEFSLNGRADDGRPPLAPHKDMSNRY